MKHLFYMLVMILNHVSSGTLPEYLSAQNEAMSYVPEEDRLCTRSPESCAWSGDALVRGLVEEKATVATVEPTIAPVEEGDWTDTREGHWSGYAEGVMEATLAHRINEWNYTPSWYDDKEFVTWETVDNTIMFKVDPIVHEKFGNRFIAVLDHRDALKVWCVTAGGMQYSVYALDWAHPDHAQADAVAFESNGFIGELGYEFWLLTVFESGSTIASMSIGWCKE